MRHQQRRWSTVAAACAVVVLVPACGGGDDDASGETAAATNTVTARTPVATQTASPTPAVATAAGTPVIGPTQPSGDSTPGATRPPPPPPTPHPTQPPVGQSLTFVGKDNLFVPRSGTATAGVPLTIALDNQDVAVAHDFVIYAPDGTEAGRTEILSGPVVQSFTFVPGAGRYAFKCSVHPQTMTGTLTVQ